MIQPTPLYIVASPRPRVGKTLIARLLVELLHASRRPVVGFDLNPREPVLAGYFPRWVWTVDIADTRGQMALFDQLIAHESGAKVIDLGYAAFEQFFNVMSDIGFLDEARQRLIEPIVLFLTDTAATTVRAYADLRHRLTQASLVPLHNEAVSVMFSREDFPPAPAACGVITIPRLPALVRGVLDRPTFSFAAHIGKEPRGPTEIQRWVGEIFHEFRELELRLMMGRLGSALRSEISEHARTVQRVR